MLGVAGKKWRCKGKVVHASLFGVGAPEALVIGVVALLVFGPKGLAEDVSREFKTPLNVRLALMTFQVRHKVCTVLTEPTLSQLLHQLSAMTILRPVVDPNGTSPPDRAYTTEEYLKITEEQLKACAIQQQVQSPSPLEESPSNTQATITETAGTVPPPQKPEI